MNIETKKKVNNRYKKIIIKYDDKITSTYSLNTYNEHPFLKDFIPKNQFNDILDKANIIIYDAKMKKAKYDKVGVNKITYILIFISFLFTLIYILLFYFAPRVETKQNKLKIVGIIFFSLSLAILISIELFFSLQTIHGDKALFEFYKEEIQNYIDKLNKEWENVMFFKYDKFNKNIICFVKINKDSNDTNDSSMKDININNKIIQ